MAGCPIMLSYEAFSTKTLRVPNKVRVHRFMKNYQFKKKILGRYIIDILKNHASLETICQVSA